MIIYKAKNCIDGKVYIGQTRETLKRRRWCHLVASLKGDDKGKSHFHDAIRCYGVENFIFETLCECSSVEELNAREKEYIALYESTNREKGYNLTLGGGGGNTWEGVSEERRRERSETLSKSQKKAYEDPERREKAKKALQKAHEAKKIRRLNGIFPPPMPLDSRKRIGEQTRARNLEKGVKPPSRLGSKHSEESKKRMSEKASRSWAEKYSETGAKKRKEKASNRWKGDNNPNAILLTKEKKISILLDLQRYRLNLGECEKRFQISVYKLREFFKSLGIKNYRHFKCITNDLEWSEFFKEALKNENRIN